MVNPDWNPLGSDNDIAYRRWREWKLEQAPKSAGNLIVEVADPRALSSAEHTGLLDRLRCANMAIYASHVACADKATVQGIGRQFGLEHMDANWLADEDGISEIAASADNLRQSYIPYTNRPIKWHTDGYYNPPDRQICAMVLHCAGSAAEGGENRLMDHEIAYLLLRDANPDFVRALFAHDALTIPERTDEDGVARTTQTGPVFSIDPASGDLRMRYTARTRSIEWKQDKMTLAAVAYLEKLLASDSPHIYRVLLEPGMGLLCNNVLHDRAGFIDSPGHVRLLYRARYYDRTNYP
jgi:hypothetical protein